MNKRENHRITELQRNQQNLTVLTCSYNIKYVPFRINMVKISGGKEQKVDGGQKKCEERIKDFTAIKILLKYLNTFSIYSYCGPDLNNSKIQSMVLRFWPCSTLCSVQDSRQEVSSIDSQPISPTICQIPLTVKTLSPRPEVPSQFIVLQLKQIKFNSTIGSGWNMFSSLFYYLKSVLCPRYLW